MSLNAGFEVGTNGATISTADRGDGNAWDVVTVGTGSTLVYDTAHAAAGVQAAKVANGAAAASYVGWTSLGTLTDHYGRAYLYFTAFPSQTFTWVRYLTGGDGGTIVAGIGLNATGKLRLNRSGDTNAATSTNAITLNRWIRVEWHIVHSSTVGSLELKLFNTATASTATETLTVTSQDTGASTDACRFGVVGAPAGALGPFWIDQLQAAASAYPGSAGPRVIARARTAAGTARAAATARTVAAARVAA